MTRTYWGCVDGKVVVVEQQETPDDELVHAFTVTRYGKIHPHVELWIWADE